MQFRIVESLMKTAAPITQMGLGTGRLASLGVSLTRRQSTLLIHTSIDHGIRVIDTADTYGSGDSERAIGAALQERSRGDCFLISKGGLPYVALPAVLSPLNQIGKKVLQKVSPKRDFSKPYLLRCIERSLKRLRTNYLDAFMLHAPVAGEPSSQSWEALETIRSMGMSRFTGVSTGDFEVVRQGVASGQVNLVETPVSFAACGAEEIISFCASRQIPVVANEVLRPRFLLHDRDAEWISLRERYNVSHVGTAQLLIGYAAAQQGVSSVLIGTTSPDHLVENLRSLQYCDTMPAFFTEMKEVFT
jgi:aryl-alcohol dehydrogenase-like predicted oxidoreductase